MCMHSLNYFNNNFNKPFQNVSISNILKTPFTNIPKVLMFFYLTVFVFSYISFLSRMTSFGYDFTMYSLNSKLTSTRKENMDEVLSKYLEIDIRYLYNRYTHNEDVQTHYINLAYINSSYYVVNGIFPDKFSHNNVQYKVRHLNMQGIVSSNVFN